MTFLSAIFLNHSASLFVTETNKQEFAEVVTSLLEYAYDLSETSVSKLAITQLINVVNFFGNGGKIHDPEDKYANNLPPVEGIDAFLMSRVTQLSFELPFQKQEFDLKDAQYRLIGQEISLLLKSYQQRGGDEFLSYLSNYLTNMGSVSYTHLDVYKRQGPTSSTTLPIDRLISKLRVRKSGPS